MLEKVVNWAITQPIDKICWTELALLPLALGSEIFDENFDFNLTEWMMDTIDNVHVQFGVCQARIG